MELKGLFSRFLAVIYSLGLVMKSLFVKLLSDSYLEEYYSELPPLPLLNL